jgi:choline-sulfatase
MEICDADAVDRQCRADQAARIASLGGRKACQEAFVFNHTPTPSEQAAMGNRHG